MDLYKVPIVYVIIFVNRQFTEIINRDTAFQKNIIPWYQGIIYNINKNIKIEMDKYSRERIKTLDKKRPRLTPERFFIFC